MKKAVNNKSGMRKRMRGKEIGKMKKKNHNLRKGTKRI
jgi:hypothetical protein